MPAPDSLVGIEALGVFLATPFDGGRHEARVEMLGRLDETNGAAEV
ncbi:MAG: hypothetical protein KGP12_02915 [Actinomycetales bacterium]|nr:hypothetical protein [Actinomycetales bacterium]